VAQLEGDLTAVEARVRPGFADGGGPANRPHRSRAFLPRSESPAAAVERLGDDLDRFRSEQKLDTVIVVNVASTEPPLPLASYCQELWIEGDQAAAFFPRFFCGSVCTPPSKCTPARTSGTSSAASTLRQ